jgi:hypothetical protein
MNPPFEDIMNMISNKNNIPLIEFSSKEIINELKIIAITELLKKYSKYNGKKDGKEWKISFD